MKTFKRKGFTLVELLIIMIVLSILTGAMVLSSTEITASADANKIVNDLTTLKMATLAWYRDNQDKITPGGRVKIGSRANRFNNGLLKAWGLINIFKVL